MNTQTSQLKADLTNLLAGNTKPSSVVGTGYRNARKTASEWLRKEMHNHANPSAAVNQIIVTTSGKAFSSESKAMQSPSYKSLIAGTFEVWKTHKVTDFGVMPSEFGDGYEIYIECTVIKAIH